MGLMDVLRKLGIVQAGAVAATYTSAQDRPQALQDEHVLGADDRNGASDADNSPSEAGDSSND